jgi:hypothetical protein
MSAVLVRQALEVAIAAMSPALATAYENAPFTPTNGTPYQRVTMLLAQPANDEFSAVHREEGFLQVDLCYPLGAGPATATARAELIRTTFARGASFTASGVTVNIDRTPEIMPGRTEEDRFVIPVRIPFHAHIRS